MATNTKSFAPTKVIIPCTISYANIWTPKAINDSDPKYSVSCVFSKSDTATLEKVNKAIEAAKQAGKEKKWGGKIPAGPSFKLPLHDGDEERPDDPTYKGCYYINASSREAPQIVDRRRNPIIDPMQVYSGCKCMVSVNFYPFAAGGNASRGIAAGLGNVQLVAAGERLGGRSSAEDDFDDLGDGDFAEDLDFLN